MLHLQLERCSSPIGLLMLVTDAEGVLRTIEFQDDDARLHASLRAQYREYVLEEAHERSGVAKALDAYFAGDVRAIDALPVATSGTDFQREVWAALRTIPAGGNDGVFCDRCCNRTAQFDARRGTGYGGGLARKSWLLQHESDHTGPEALKLF